MVFRIAVGLRSVDAGQMFLPSVIIAKRHRKFTFR